MLYRTSTAPNIGKLAETNMDVIPHIGQDHYDKYEAVYDQPVEISATGTNSMSKCVAYHVVKYDS